MYVFCIVSKGGREEGERMFRRIAKQGLPALKEENGYLTKVEIDKMSCFVRHIATEITSYNAMPRWIVLFIELFLDKCCNILKVKTNGY
jgi:hypothetical protein